ncbi:hypothetical protein OSB04_018048 [Centaurea solstitialis]|uniref:Uncharacterized protein n=1 Tax=Centaurea solstitialis TaxID=347529 RepID=A0AA38TP11_9ASTR|nr:hypothetical protein OSB04_018048 [Centaurea solstitialis]
MGSGEEEMYHFLCLKRSKQKKMAYMAGLRVFMDNLKKLIHGNHHPLFNNDPLIISKRPQFQLLYQELDIIQTLFSIHQHHQGRP